jgi:hypothetical protein
MVSFVYVLFPEIFKTYDILGIVGLSLTHQVVQQVVPLRSLSVTASW